MNTKYMVTVVLISLGIIMGLLVSRPQYLPAPTNAFDKKFAALEWDMERLEFLVNKEPEQKFEAPKDRRMDKEKKK